MGMFTEAELRDFQQRTYAQAARHLATMQEQELRKATAEAQTMVNRIALNAQANTEDLEQRRQIHALALRKATAEAERAELERETARLVHDHVKNSAKWVDLPKLPGGSAS